MAAKRSTSFKKRGNRDAVLLRLHTIWSDTNQFESLLDSVIAVAIVLNTVYIALEMDANRDPNVAVDAWTYVAGVFSLLFWIEMVCKLHLRGFRGYFMSEGATLNIFDAIIILADTAQLAMTLVFAGSNSGLPSISIFRLFRIIRLVRLIRLLRSPIFKDLLTMIHALHDGLITLAWAVLLVFFMLYGTSLMCRELLGRRDVDQVKPYFDSVPRSLLTMFRCSFGDCSSDGGLPIIEHVTQAYGGVWGLLYAVFVFFMTIGLFNVITAIFLDSTLDAARSLSIAQQRKRLTDRHRWGEAVACFARKFVAHIEGEALPEGVKLSDYMEEILKVRLDRNDLNALCKNDEEVSLILDKLEIDPSDHDRLGDVLDSKHNGYLGFLDFVNGVQRLRGSNLSRSDVVSIDLMVRALQEKVNDMSEDITSLMHQCRATASLSVSAYAAASDNAEMNI